MNRQVGNLSLLRTQGQAEVPVRKRISALTPGLSVLALAIFVALAALAFVLLGLQLGAPASLEASSAAPSGHYAPNCEAAAAVSSDPGCALAQWYAARQGQQFTIACMGR